MSDFRLKKTILEVVDNQIHMDDPKCVRVALQQLIANGHSRARAKEMIAAAVTDEIFHILNDNRPFDEQRYETLLEQTVQSSKEPAEGVKNEEAKTIEQLFAKVKADPEPFPREALQEMVRRQEEAVPVLLDFLEQCYEDASEDYCEEYLAVAYATMLLAQFRAREAYPLLLDFLRLPLSSIYEYFDEPILENIGRILASVFAGNLEVLVELAEDTEVDSWLRSEAIDTLVILSERGEVPRANMIDQMRSWLRDPTFTEDLVQMLSLVRACRALAPAELSDDIERCLAR